MSALSALWRRQSKDTRRGGKARARRRARDHRGIALIMVVSSIAILTAVAVDFSFNADVDLQLATNARDELRAEYLARSAVNVSRLLLRFQRQLDGQSAMLGPLLNGLQGILGGGGAPSTIGGTMGSGGVMGSAGGAGGGLNIRLWDIVPVDCSLFGMLLGAAEPSSEMAAIPEAPAFGEEDLSSGKGAFSKGKLESFGDFSGCFHAEISDEEQKINVNRLNLGALTGSGPMLQALTMFADPRFEFLYEKPDANNVKMTPQEVLIALHDWIDERDSQASLNITGTGDPFPDGFGDENHNYSSRYPHKYRSKNALFDSLDELYQVDGVSDLFMAAFRDRLTVYPDFNRKLNINTNDPLQQIVDIMSVAANPNDPKLRNPAVIQSILQEINLSKMMMPFIGMSASNYAGIIERNGIQVRPEIKTNAANNNFITDKSETFTIKAVGQAGKVEKTVTAVVRYNEGLGKLLYYRIE